MSLNAAHRKPTIHAIFFVSSFSIPMPAMTKLTPPPIRLAYIRTIAHPETRRPNIRDFLSAYVRQSRPEDLDRGAPRHRFLFGAGNTFDADVLDVFIAQIQARTVAELPASNANNGFGWPAFSYISLSDLELRVSKACAATATGKNVLKRCADEGIATVISGISDEECDELMLQESHYLIDFLTHDYCHPFHSHFPKHIRAGNPEDNMLTNAKYNVDQHDVSQYRLRNRYAGYAWKESSGGYHGNGYYRCAVCGGNCKRTICKGRQVDEKRIVERQKWEETEEAWREENLTSPMPGSANWRDRTANDLCWRFSMLKLPRYKDAKQWHSIDTFSGE
jgi:hypothetical protein